MPLADLTAFAGNVSEQYLEALVRLISIHHEEVHAMTSELVQPPGDLKVVQPTLPFDSSESKLPINSEFRVTVSSPSGRHRSLPVRAPRPDIPHDVSSPPAGDVQDRNIAVAKEDNQAALRISAQSCPSAAPEYQAGDDFSKQGSNIILHTHSGAGFEYQPQEMQPSGFEVLKAPNRSYASLQMSLADEEALRKFVTVAPSKAVKKSDENLAVSTATILMDTAVAVSIVINAFVIGVETDHMARRLSRSSPPVFDHIEIFFCAIFTGEILIRFLQYRAKFFTMRGKHWHAFDTTLVLMQWVDVIGLLVNPMNLTFLRLIRLLRLLRVLRVVRLLQFFGQANVVLDAIYSSTVNLLATGIILFVMIYCVAVVITQAVGSYRVYLQEQGKMEYEDLAFWWGTLWRSMLTLLECVLDGTDWDNALQAIAKVSISLEIVFVMFVVFVMLAMLNVVTGIFVQAALKNADKSRDAFFISHVKQLFHMLDPSFDGQISREKYMDSMKSDDLQKHMYEMDIDPREAMLLFNYIDSDDSNTISADELLSGLVRLRAGAKYMDVMSLYHEVELQNVRWSTWFQRLEQMMIDVASLQKGMLQRSQV